MNVFAECSISLPGQTLFYYKSGSGKMPLLAFHGFGQDHKSFHPWVAPLGQEYTLLLVDLYFHGHSAWNDVDSPLEKSVWKLVIGKLLQQEDIRTFALAGYSLGGKFALATLEAFPDRVKKVCLIAPDGILRNYWYSLATWPVPVRKLFRSIIRHERRFTRLVWIARRLGFADSRALRFAGNQMDSTSKRARVYNTWVVFRHLHVNLHEVFRLTTGSRIPVMVIAGKRDRVVPAGALRKAFNRLKNVDFHIVDSGHNDLIVASIPFLTGQANSL